jgi:hypothetical protein
MLLIYGKRLFGKVDRIPGLGEVQTQFYHLYWIPLIPIESVFVTGSDGDEIAGAVLFELDGRSVLAAYLRAALVIAAIVAAFSGLSGSPGAWLACAACVGALVYTYRAMGTASATRTAALLRKLNVDMVETTDETSPHAPG